MEDLRKLMNESCNRRVFYQHKKEVFEDEVKELEKTFMEILVSVFPSNYANMEESPSQGRIFKGRHSRSH